MWCHGAHEPHPARRVYDPSQRGDNAAFKCLEAGVNLNTLLFNAEDEERLGQDSPKLLKAWGRGEVGRLGAGGG